MSQADIFSALLAANIKNVVTSNRALIFNIVQAGELINLLIERGFVIPVEKMFWRQNLRTIIDNNENSTVNKSINGEKYIVIDVYVYRVFLSGGS